MYKLVILDHCATCNKKLLQQAILIYGINVGSIAQWGVKNQKQPDLNTNYMYKQMAGHSYSHSRSCDKCPPSSFLLLSHIVQIKESRRPWAWLIFCFNLFHFGSVQFMCRRRTRNEEHPVRIDNIWCSGCSFAIALHGESVPQCIWQFKIRVLNLYYLATEHQNIVLLIMHPMIW